MRALIAPILLFYAVVTQAATYYVDSTAGNDSNSGSTPVTAWRSLEKINTTTFEPGDKLLLKAGGAWTGRLHPKGSGTAANRIIIDRYAGGPQPVIHGGGIAGGAVLLENQQYWSIRNLEITNRGSKEPKKMGILIRNTSVGTLCGIEVSGCTIHDVEGEMADYKDGKESGGIVFYINTSNVAVPSRWDDIRIESNTIRDVARNGILMQSLWINKPGDPNSSWRGHSAYTPSTNIRIAGNRLERIGGDGIIPWCVKGAIIESNFVRAANNNLLKQGHAAVWTYFCEDVIFQFNEVCETKTKFDGMAFDFDNSNQRCIYQYNYSHDNEGGFLNMCCDGNGNGNIARYNISQNDGCLAGSRVSLSMVMATTTTGFITTRSMSEMAILRCFIKERIAVRVRFCFRTTSSSMPAREPSRLPRVAGLNAIFTSAPVMSTVTARKFLAIHSLYRAVVGAWA